MEANDIAFLEMVAAGAISGQVSEWPQLRPAMDSYQPIYDATRSRIDPCNTSNVIERVAYSTLDFSHARMMVQEVIATAGYEYTRPSVLFRPAISIDGNKWCALYGDNLQDGVAGFGDSPALACEDFDKNWNAKLCKAPT